MPSTFGLGAVLSQMQWAGGSSPPAWTPTDPVAPALWLDGQTAALWQDTAGTVPAASGGDPVARADVSHGTNLTQPTGTARATRDALAGKTALAFDGVDDRLTSAQTIANGAFTFAFCYQHSTALGASERDVVATLGMATVGRCGFHVAGASASLPHLSVQMGTASTAHVGANVALADTARHIVLVRFLGGTVTDVANWKIDVDGVSQTVVTRAAVTPAGTMAIGARSDGNSPGALRIGEVIAWVGALGDPDASACYSYMAGRW